MKEIQLTQGRIALVDDADYDHLMVRSWCYSGGYAWAKINGRKESMHRHLLDVPKGMDVDHINHNGCDNQRYNMRPATRSQNASHTNHIYQKKTSRFRGVSWDKERCLWMAMIAIDKHNHNLGRFEKEEDAAKIYDTFAIATFGEFASLNFSDENDRL